MLFDASSFAPVPFVIAGIVAVLIPILAAHAFEKHRMVASAGRKVLTRHQVQDISASVLFGLICSVATYGILHSAGSALGIM